VNEEDPEPRGATALPRCRRLVPPCYVPEGGSRRRKRSRRREVY